MSKLYKTSLILFFLFQGNVIYARKSFKKRRICGSIILPIILDYPWQLGTFSKIGPLSVGYPLIKNPGYPKKWREISNSKWTNCNPHRFHQHKLIIVKLCQTQVIQVLFLRYNIFNLFKLIQTAPNLSKK